MGTVYEIQSLSGNQLKKIRSVGVYHLVKSLSPNIQGVPNVTVQYGYIKIKFIYSRVY